jgi:hypothetical protein
MLSKLSQTEKRNITCPLSHTVSGPKKKDDMSAKWGWGIFGGKNQQEWGEQMKRVKWG